MTAPRLALIGCGAIAERFHLPAIRRDPRLLPGLVLVDPDRRRAEALAALAGGGATLAGHEELEGRVDAAIVTAPHELHHPIAKPLLARGIHVLCEKPLAATAEEARDLVDTAERAGAILAVNNTRRLYPAHRKVRALLDEGAIGAPRALAFEDGDKFDWPLASGAMFGARGGGRGVLLDIGAHVLDLARWWLGPATAVAGYRDDAMGGSEATAEVALRAGDCTATVRLSWLSKLRNGFVITGEAGEIAGGIYDWNSLDVTVGGRRRRVSCPGAARLYGDFADELLRDFTAAIATGGRPLVTGADVLPSLELIDACYARRERLPMPWFDAWRKVVA
jgi:predicted dehydrogenase